MLSTIIIPLPQQEHFFPKMILPNSFMWENINYLMDIFKELFPSNSCAVLDVNLERNKRKLKLRSLKFSMGKIFFPELKTKGIQQQNQHQYQFWTLLNQGKSYSFESILAPALFQQIVSREVMIFPQPHRAAKTTVINIPGIGLCDDKTQIYSNSESCQRRIFGIQFSNSNKLNSTIMINRNYLQNEFPHVLLYCMAIKANVIKKRIN